MKVRKRGILNYPFKTLLSFFVIRTFFNPNHEFLINSYKGTFGISNLQLSSSIKDRFSQKLCLLVLIVNKPYSIIRLKNSPSIIRLVKRF